MERIKVIARLLMIIALTTLICTFVPDIYSRSLSSSHSYEDFSASIQEIANELSINAAQIPLTEAEFKEGIKEEELKTRFLDWLHQAPNGNVYSEQTINDVTSQMIQLYQNQKLIEKDEVYHTYTTMVRFTSCLVIVLSGGILIIISKKKKRPYAS